MIIKKQIKEDTLATFKRIESQAVVMLDLDRKQQADDFRKSFGRRG